MRHAVDKDCWWVYRIGMDALTREMSTRSERFSREEHQDWYARRRADPDQMFLIGRAEGKDVGYVRFGRTTARELAAVASTRRPDPSAVEVAIAIASSERGHGYAVPLLLAAERELRARWPDVTRSIALILPKNAASLVVFARAGYRAAGDEERLGKVHRRYEKVL